MNARLYKILFLIIGILSLGYMVNAMGIDVIWENIQKTGLWFIPVIGSWLLIYALNAWAFKAIIQEDHLPKSNLSYFSVLKLTISGYAINYITPFVALGGEPYRIFELKPALGIQKATSSVLLYSLIHMFSHVLFWLFSIVLIVAFVPLNDLLLMGCLALFIIGIVLTFWFIRVYKKGFTVSTFRLLEKIPFVKHKAKKFAAEKAESLIEVDNQIRVLYADRKDRFYLSLVLEFVARVIGCLEIYFTARAIGMDMSVVQSLIVSSGSSLFANLVFFFPMQLGTREGGLVLALKSVGLLGSAGIFIGIVMRIREFVWIIIGLLMMNKKSNSIENSSVETIELKN